MFQSDASVPHGAGVTPPPRTEPRRRLRPARRRGDASAVVLTLLSLKDSLTASIHWRYTCLWVRASESALNFWTIFWYSVYTNCQSIIQTEYWTFNWSHRMWNCHLKWLRHVTSELQVSSSNCSLFSLLNNLWIISSTNRSVVWSVQCV